MKKIMLIIAVFAVAASVSANLITDPNINSMANVAAATEDDLNQWNSNASYWDTSGSGARLISSWSDKKMTWIGQNTGDDTLFNFSVDWSVVGTGAVDMFVAVYGVNSNFTDSFTSSTRTLIPSEAVALLSDAAYDNDGDGIIEMDGLSTSSGTLTFSIDTGVTYDYIAVVLGGWIHTTSGQDVTYDNVDLSLAVPEPATVGMLGLGALVSLMVRRIRK